MYKALLLVALIFSPGIASAHEVYVLPHDIIIRDVAAVSPSPLQAIAGNYGNFLLWGFISVVVTFAIFSTMFFARLQRRFDPLLKRLKKYAAPTARITLGVCLIAAAQHSALFGPELPFSSFVPGYEGIISWLLYVIGTLIVFGLFTRTAAAIVLFVYAFSVVRFGIYMLNYANYCGEALFLFIIGGGYLSFDRLLGNGLARSVRSAAHRLEPYAFPILRVLFGVAIMFASVYAKFIHSDLALDTINLYNLTRFFPFDPLFVALGAFIIESLVGVFIIIGFEIRWTAMFFLFWLGLSLWYFGESVWPHLVLLGLNLVLIFHGYDKYSLVGRFLKNGDYEPVL